jgi:DNA-binding CsgD family transcriptional regulator/tetratricopeptide (TPR) repeat protein
VSGTRSGRPLVGRVAERAILAGCLRSTIGGQRQVVLVAGEPGAGKTRLAEEAVDQARESGLACALGRASEDEGSPPYWPFLQVFRGLGVSPPAELYGELTGDDGPAGSARERFRLFEVTTEALVAAAQPSGLLIVLDDLQWADAATVRLLVHLATGLTPVRLMVVATYRDTETTGQERLRAAIATLAREASVTRVRPGGLSEAEVAAHLAAMTGWEVPGSVTAAIYRRTQGNPFFVGELGRLLGSSTDGQLPDGVRDAVRDRLNRLSPSCHTLVASAAVLGSDVDPVAVAHVTGTDVAAVLAALDEATVAAILTGPPARRFAHDLFREAARLDVPTVERLTLHRRMAEHLSTRGDGDARVTEIAFHWLESLPAGDAAQAVAWAERAADRAMAQLAWEEAASLYQRALAAGDAHGVTAPADRCRLLLAMARAQVRAFDLDDARRSLLAAVDIARAAGDVESLARAALTMEGINDVAWDPTSRVLCAEVLDKLPIGDSAVRARLLALLVAAGGWAVPETSRVRSAEALAMAERVGDRHGLREALRARQMALSGPDGAAERLALGDRLVALGGDSDDDAVLWGRLWRFDALAQLGELDAAEAEVERINAVAVRLRSPLAAWHVARCRAAVAAARGRFQQALAYGQEAELAAKRAGSQGAHVPSQGLLSMLYNQVGALGSPPFEPIEPQHDAPVPAFQWAMYATWLLAEGRRDEAHRIYRALPPVGELPPFVHLSAYATMAELASQVGDRQTAAQMYRLLLPHAELFVCSGAGVIMILGTVRYPLGVAAATMGRLDDAVRHLRAAIDSGERTGMPPVVALATYQLARVLARRTRPGDRDEAAALATAAATLADQLGMRPLQRQAQDLAASLTGHRPSRLTRREQEVAVLVARGLSNRQIGAAAHISERTVESHVQHILDKLGFANRAQVAAWVAADGGKFSTGSP